MSYGRLWVSIAAMVAFGAACGSQPSAAPAPPPPLPCAHPEGLDPEACLLPWPSSAFLVADPTTRTGFRVSIGADATPQTQTTGQNVDPTPWNAWDGFSPMTSLLAEFASVVDPTPLPTWQDPGPSLDPSSPTVLVDVDTGQRIAHFSEIETSPDVAPGHTELYIRPAARLAEGHHYAVGIRGLTNNDGTAVAVSAPFAALRDNRPSRRPSTPGAPASRRTSSRRSWPRASSVKGSSSRGTSARPRARRRGAISWRCATRPSPQRARTGSAAR